MSLTIKTRISLPDRDGMNAEQKRVHDKIVSGRRGELVGPLRAALHNPKLAEQWSQLGESLRFNTRLPARLSEMVVLMTARVYNSEVEWSIHRSIATKAGLEPAFIDAIRDGVVPAFADDADREIYRYVSELLARANVADEVYEAVLARWGEGGIVELTALVGYYCMVALTLNVHGIPLPADLEGDLMTNSTLAPTGLSKIPHLA